MLSSRTRRGRKRSAASAAGSSVPHSSGGSPTAFANGGGSAIGELCAELEMGRTEDRTKTAAAALHRPRRQTLHSRAVTGRGEADCTPARGQMSPNVHGVLPDQSGYLPLDRHRGPGLFEGRSTTNFLLPIDRRISSTNSACRRVS